MNKKYVITNKFRFITFITILMLIVAFSVSALFGFGSAAGRNIIEYKNVLVKSGDTLWDLAKQYGPSNVDCRKVVHEIQKINNVSPETLYAGQYISIPTSL